MMPIPQTMTGIEQTETAPAPEAMSGIERTNLWPGPQDGMYRALEPVEPLLVLPIQEFPLLNPLDNMSGPVMPSINTSKRPVPSEPPPPVAELVADVPFDSQQRPFDPQQIPFDSQQGPIVNDNDDDNDDIESPQDMLANEHLFATLEDHATVPSPLNLAGLCGFQPPIPRNKYDPVYRRCLTQPETHPSDGQWNGRVTRGMNASDIPVDMVWVAPGKCPPDDVRMFWDNIIGALDMGLQQRDPEWMSKSRFTHKGWNQYDDTVMRGVNDDDPFKIRDGKRNGSRDVFAWGGLIIKSNHRRTGDKEDPLESKYARDDLREMNVRKLVVNCLPDVMQHMPPPRLLFTGVLNRKNVLILERIMGTSVSRLIPRIDALLLGRIREIVRCAIQLIGLESPRKPGCMFMHNELLPNNIFMKFITLGDDGNEVVKYTLDPTEPLPPQIRLAGFIDWKEMIWAEPAMVIGRHNLSFWGGFPLEEMILDESATDEQTKTKVWNDLYVGLFPCTSYSLED